GLDRAADVGADQPRAGPARDHDDPQRDRPTPGRARGRAAGDELMTGAVIAQPSMAARLTGARVGRRRTVVDRSMRTIAMGAAFLCALPLAAVLFFVAANGLSALSLDLITKPPRALGIGGGAANAVVGTLQMVPLAALIAVPVGVLGAVYIAEFANSRSARVIRFCADVLVGMPSILIGVFVFTFLVLPFKQF